MTVLIYIKMLGRILCKRNSLTSVDISLPQAPGDPPEMISIPSTLYTMSLECCMLEVYLISLLTWQKFKVKQYGTISVA